MQGPSQLQQGIVRTRVQPRLPLPRWLELVGLKNLTQASTAEPEREKAEDRHSNLVSLKLDRFGMPFAIAVLRNLRRTREAWSPAGARVGGRLVQAGLQAWNTCPHSFASETSCAADPLVQGLGFNLADISMIHKAQGGQGAWEAAQSCSWQVAGMLQGLAAIEPRRPRGKPFAAQST